MPGTRANPCIAPSNARLRSSTTDQQRNKTSLGRISKVPAPRRAAFASSRMNARRRAESSFARHLVVHGLDTLRPARKRKLGLDSDAAVPRPDRGGLGVADDLQNRLDQPG